MGLAFIAIGIVVLVLSYSAQSEMDKIGATNDPILQERFNALQDQRDAFLVTSLGVIFVGFFALAILDEASVPEALGSSQMMASARSFGDMASGLSLKGNAMFLPAKRGLTRERVFMPSSSNGGTSPPIALTDSLVITPGKDGSTPGILIEPAGLQLLDLIEKELGVSLKDAGIDGAEGALQIMKHGIGILKDFHFKDRDGDTYLRVEYKSMAKACAEVRKERPDTCRQSPCIGCSCLLAGAARATGKSVAIVSVDNSSDTVVFKLKIQEW